MDAQVPMPVFRWDGKYWGFVLGSRLHDRYGRQAGWLEPRPTSTPHTRDRRPAAPGPETAAGEGPAPPAQVGSLGMDLYDLSGRFLGELWEGQHVLRSVLRNPPVPRAARAPVPHPAPPAPAPDHEPRDPLDDWRDALPWPLFPPMPPRV